MPQESFPLIFKPREIEILKNVPVKIWLPRKRQAPWTAPCHIKLEKSPSLVVFALIKSY